MYLESTYYLFNMGKGKSCDVSTRKIIVQMHQDGKSYREIAKALKVSKTMVFQAVQYFKKHSTTEKVSRKQRSRITTAHEDALIVRESKKNPHKSANEIRTAVFGENEAKPSVDTVKRRLREAGLFGRISRKKPLLSERNRKKRLEFAKKYRHWTAVEWKRVLFSDETKINRVSPDGKKYVRRPKLKEFDPKYTRVTLKHGGGSIMLWGAMSSRGVGPLRKIEGNMDKFQYSRILNDTMMPYADENMPVTWIFQQDNDPKHTAHHVKQWFSDNSVTVLDWPSCSPDLNPIENLWHVVKTKVSVLKITNFDNLYAETKKAWEAIPRSVCENLVASMPRTCQAVIDNKGFATKY